MVSELEMTAPVPTGLVLSGGGARGAYAAGLLQAMVEILGLLPSDPAPFQIFSGTSVGSINACFLAANAQRGDLGIFRLGELWKRLQINELMRTSDKSLDLRQLTSGWFSNSVLDSRPLERLVQENISFDQLHDNVTQGRVRALMVAAFNIRSAQTTIFTELSPGTLTRTPRDPSRHERLVKVSVQHVLASSAMPFIFPACRIEDDYYCDGGLRFNTPVSAAIRAGAERLVVISLSNARKSDDSRLHEYPSAPFLAGRLLNALLLDPVDYDLEVLERFNRLSSALQDALPAPELARVNAVLTETRGAPYRVLEKLVFTPSEDLGRLANEHLREHLPSYKVGKLPRYFLRKAATKDATWEADWAAYLLFDGAYATRLMALGRKDGFSRQREILEFFGRVPERVNPTTGLP
jgi:NTE family protein